jgi:phosphoribosyl-AMP cyclohydrolase / phosphoribosyl-ATP pyrophosphohydrolase
MAKEAFETKPDFTKLQDANTGTGLIPAVVQEEETRRILMVGFMTEDAFDLTLETRKVTFWSRTRKTLWTKGETSGNFLELRSWRLDCDDDTLLIEAKPNGPTCHRPDKWTCFDS